MHRISWLLAGASASCLLMALLWGWQARCRQLMRAGRRPAQAALQAWEAPFLKLLAMAGSLPLINEWLYRFAQPTARDPVGALARTLALASLLALGSAAALLRLGFPLRATAWSCAAIVPVSLMHWLQQVRISQRKQAGVCRRDLPFFLDLLVLAVESGLGLQQAWTQSLESLPDGTLRHVLSMALADMRTGRRLSQTMRSAGRRIRLADLEELALALELAQETGLSLASLLRAQSEQLRNRLHLEAEQRALKLPVHLLLPLVVCIFPCTFLVLGMTLLGPWLSAPF